MGRERCYPLSALSTVVRRRSGRSAALPYPLTDTHIVASAEQVYRFLGHRQGSD